ncbi:MAG: hypothetical protein JWO09_455 [Bacteroidetes bacterium]|nr:hypothetical protein [Bacteroidota bacterium]
MKQIGIVLFTFVLFSACKKDPVLKTGTSTGTPGWPQGCWNVKYEVSGTTVPDSVHLNINMIDYIHNFISPSLTLTDSTNFCGDVNSDVNIFLFDHDTSHVYTCKIWINNVLKANVTGKSDLPPYWLSAGAQCQ